MHESVLVIPENNFHDSMKKSLLQMDQFMQATPLWSNRKNEFSKKAIHQLQLAWMEFARSDDSSVVGQVQQILAAIQSAWSAEPRTP